jgi:membrane-bound metal-dependent hydrolase YbcI (DUF457 family)
MFIGHFAIGFGVKKADHLISLGTAFIAVQFLDLLWPLLVITGIEQVEVDIGNTAFTPLDFTHYPYSHSLVAALFWSVLFGNVCYFVYKRHQTAIISGLLVFSHWILDLITHTDDLPVSPWSETKVGLGLWDSIPGTVILELGLFLTGIYLYHKSTRAVNRKGNILLFSLILFLLISYFANIFGPPPPSGKEVAYVALSMWLLVAWGYWIDRNREPVNS